MSKADIGLVGLAVMGENLCLNMESKGFSVAAYNRSPQTTENFVNGRAKGKNIVGYKTVQEFVDGIKTPRKIMLMVKAGSPVDTTIDTLIPFLDEGDIIVDGGNTHYPDSLRREQYLKEKGIHFVGAGVSGGEEGALKGPSIMPGGSEKAWAHLKDIFQKISAQVDGAPCCEWIGPEGSGHFVKMVHNGIEYGDMQLICEAYHLLKAAGISHERIAKVFEDWNKGPLNSYLIEITAQILAYKDGDGYLVDKILDTAGQKGTGKWTSVSALDIGVPLTLISEAVFSRYISALKDERTVASKILTGPTPNFSINEDEFIKDVEQALYASKIVSYAQGYDLLTKVSTEYNWNLKPGEIATIWRGGCIIRSAFLNNIKEAYDKSPNLQNLLLDDFFKTALTNANSGWRKVCSLAVLNGVPVPAFTSALGYYDSYRSETLPANLLQAQRDYFGAHTYERTDKPRGEYFHTNWTGTGGTTASTVYNA